MKAFRSFSIAVVLLVLPSALTLAQSYRGSIRGTVTDPSGAVVPNATVIAKNLANGLVRTVQSDGDGNYQIVELPAGNYDITVDVTGFHQFKRRVDVAVGLDTTVPIPLDLGMGDRVIDVTETAPLVETTRDVLGQVVENKLVTELPLNGRDFGKLVALTPGVTVEGARCGRDGKRFRTIQYQRQP